MQYQSTGGFEEGCNEKVRTVFRRSLKIIPILPIGQDFWAIGWHCADCWRVMAQTKQE